jgi:hypothetical protein
LFDNGIFSGERVGVFIGQPTRAKNFEVVLKKRCL